MLKKRFAKTALLLLTVPACLSLSCISRQRQRMLYTNAPAELAFSTPKHEFERVFPGIYDGSVELKNVSANTLKDVLVSTSCFCLKIKSATHFDSLAPGQSVEIPFAIDVAMTGPYKQIISANINGQKRLYFHPVYAIGIAPISELHDTEIVLPDIQRENISQNSQTVTVIKPVETQAKNLTISANAAWLRIKTRMDGNRVVLDATTAPSAPNGDFSVPGNIKYTSNARKIDLNVTISGKIVSQVTAEPALLSFGMVPKGKETAPQTCVVQVTAPFASPVTVSCEENRVHAKVTRQESNKLLLEIRIDTAKSGEIDSVVRVLQNGKTLTDIPVSAFISP